MLASCEQDGGHRAVVTPRRWIVGHAASPPQRRLAPRSVTLVAKIDMDSTSVPLSQTTGTDVQSRGGTDVESTVVPTCSPGFCFLMAAALRAFLDVKTQGVPGPSGSGTATPLPEKEPRASFWK